jgi:type II secretory pathway pseudopilin PulG
MHAQLQSDTSNRYLPLGSGLLTRDDGVSLVSVMLALSLLAVFALVAASLAVNERRTAFNDLAHTQSFVAADSGGEAAIAWLLDQHGRPNIDASTGEVEVRSMTAMHTSSYQDYSFDIRMRPNPNPTPDYPWQTEIRPGYDPGHYRDFFYDVDAAGSAGIDGRSDVSVIVSKLTQGGYN